MARFWFGMGCLVVGLAVATDIFGAGILKQRLTNELRAVFETGLSYQMFHGLGMVLLALAMDRWGGAVFQWVCGLWLAGIVLFSGSLYAQILTGVRGLGAVLLLGFLCFLVGWGLLVWEAWRNLGRQPARWYPGTGKVVSKGIEHGEK